MNTADIMNNEAYTPILFEIERRILACVHRAKAEGVELNDSQIRSILNKVRKTAEGGSPEIPEESPRDRVLADLHSTLSGLRRCLYLEDECGESTKLPIKLWTLCVGAIEESVQRYSTGPGSKGYQEFLESFMARATGTPQSDF